jgi:ABC-type branched-subunit amino acid transport system ATPase component
MALEHSNRAYVLENGSTTMQGTSTDIKGNSRIVEAYLGV